MYSVFSAANHLKHKEDFIVLQSNWKKNDKQKSLWWRAIFTGIHSIPNWKIYEFINLVPPDEVPEWEAFQLYDEGVW